jgi:phosphoglycerate dehydrogenase-like enzyme
MTKYPPRLVLVISTPLEYELVERIRQVAPDRVEVRHVPDLLPIPRYPADHSGPRDFRRSARDEKRWHELIASADILWDIPPKLADGSNAIDDAKKLRWVQTTSSGVGPLVKKLQLIERGIQVTTARGLHAGPLTEFVFLALLMHAKGLLRMQKEQAAHHWEYTCSGTLEGKTLAIAGLGGIGRRIAATGKQFGMTVAGLLRPGVTVMPEEFGIDQLFAAEAFHEMLAATDALVLCAPHTPDTHRMLNQAAFDALKPGAVLINIARGTLVDEAAMIAALGSGKLAFAALDVFDTEPLPPESPLWDMDNVLVSPHSASTVATENERIVEVFCHNLPLFLDGRVEAMRNRFHADRGY